MQRRKIFLREQIFPERCQLLSGNKILLSVAEKGISEMKPAETGRKVRNRILSQYNSGGSRPEVCCLSTRRKLLLRSISCGLADPAGADEGFQVCREKVPASSIA